MSEFYQEYKEVQSDPELQHPWSEWFSDNPMPFSNEGGLDELYRDSRIHIYPLMVSHPVELHNNIVLAW